MTREIKFRAWDSEKKLWFHFDLSQNPKYWAEKINDCPLQQYTGLKDKNGVEIYEGDILKAENSGNCVVVWYEDGACFRYKFGENLESPLNWDFPEVIGNIYENPELL